MAKKLKKLVDLPDTGFEKNPLQTEIDKLEIENLRIDEQLIYANAEVNAARNLIEETQINNDNIKSIHSENLHNCEKKRDDLLRLKEENNKKIKELNDKLSGFNNEISNNVPDSSPNGSRFGGIKQFGKNVAKGAASISATVAVNSIKSAAKTAISKVNPLDKSINKNDTTDTGFEGIKIAYQGVKKGTNAVKTVNKSIKTTHKTIKTTGTVVKTGGKAIYKTASFTAKTVAAASKAAVSAAAHILAFLSNPIIIIIIALLILCSIIAGGILTIIAGDSTSKEAATSAAGLIKVEEQYNKGVNYLNTAYNNVQNSFNGMIDSMYFNYDDLTNSDLVYMERSLSDSLQTTYETGFASDTYKSNLKASWNLSLDINEVLAITYVYLEKEQNTSHKTSLQIYEVTYTQAVLDLIISKYVLFTDTIYGGQKCPDGICTEHINPDYQTALDNLNFSVCAYNDWGDIIQYIEQFNKIKDGTAQARYWDDNVQWRIDNWNIVYSDFIPESPYYTNNGEDFLSYLGTIYASYEAIEQSTPKTLDECEYKHNLHTIDLCFYSSENVMDSLNFTDAEKQWVELTKQGFESNPNL